jgi:hypothetical protein
MHTHFAYTHFKTSVVCIHALHACFPQKRLWVHFCKNEPNYWFSINPQYFYSAGRPTDDQVVISIIIPLILF